MYLAEGPAKEILKSFKVNYLQALFDFFELVGYALSSEFQSLQ